MIDIDWSGLWSKVWPIIVAFFTGTFIGNVKTLFEIADIIDRRKTKIVVERSLSGHRDAEGNYIHIANLSGKTVMISWWEIYHRRAWWDFRKGNQSVVDSDGSPTRTLQPNEIMDLSFNDQFWFNPWPKHLPNHSLYIRYNVMGERRAREFKLTNR